MQKLDNYVLKRQGINILLFLPYLHLVGIKFHFLYLSYRVFFVILFSNTQ